MKKWITLAFILFLGVELNAQVLKPYVLGFETTQSVSVTKEIVVTNLKANKMQVVGQYQPASDVNRWVIVFTSTELINAVKLVGGKTGYAATLRIGITVENGKTIVSYTNPYYWGNAYFQGNFPKVKTNYSTLKNNIENAMKASGTFIGTEFGAKNGISPADLQKYHYMMGMPYFEDSVELEDFDSYQDAIAKIDASVKKGVPNVKLVYKVTIPGKNLTLYGFALSGSLGESQFMPIIDIGSPKHTTFLPYEVLVNNDEVEMLHGRFRIALSFPDLTMSTFSKIMSTPSNIEDMLGKLVE